MDHRKNIELDDLENFSSTRENLIVQAASTGDRKDFISADEEVFFGNDVFPCLTVFNKISGKLRKQAVPLELKLKSHMGIV